MSTRALVGMKCNRSDDSRGRALQKTLSTFYDKTLKLRDALGSFSSSDGSLSHLSRTVSISDLDKVSTQVVSGATPAQYEMTIDSLAASQTNISKKLVSEEITDLDGMPLP